MSQQFLEMPDKDGFFGEYGGQFIPPELKVIMDQVVEIPGSVIPFGVEWYEAFDLGQDAVDLTDSGVSHFESPEITRVNE